jgi:hypothetical protein
MDPFNFEDCERLQGILDIIDSSRRTQEGLLVINQELADEIEDVLQGTLDKMLIVAE